MPSSFGWHSDPAGWLEATLSPAMERLAGIKPIPLS